MTLIVRCGTCDLDYDETAYRHHLENPCDYGIYPMLACNLHRDQCPYPNAVWRRENHAEWTPRGYTGQPCRPLYQLNFGHIHYRLEEPMWSGTYMALYSPGPPVKKQAS